MGGIGVTELLIVLGIVLLIFGPKRLPMLGKQLGSGMREFKDSITKRHDRDDDDEDERPAIATAVTPAEPEAVSGEVVRDRREQ
jgi:sec-independent protein translocase protein TatA